MDADQAAYQLMQHFGGGFGFSIRRTASGYQFFRSEPTGRTVPRTFQIGGRRVTVEVQEQQSILVAEAPTFVELAKKVLEAKE